MWVSSSARGRSPPSASSSVSMDDWGPGSTSAPSTCQQPITWGRPKCITSITRIGFAYGCWGRSRRSLPAVAPASPPPTPSRNRIGEPLVRFERLPHPLLHAARRIAQLTARLLIAGPEGDAVGGGDQLAQVGRLAHQP